MMDTFLYKKNFYLLL